MCRFAKSVLCVIPVLSNCGFSWPLSVFPVPDKSFMHFAYPGATSLDIRALGATLVLLDTHFLCITNEFGQPYYELDELDVSA